MKIELIIIWLLFVFSVALTALGVLLLFKLKEKQMKSDMRLVHYAQILIYTFGFYVLWGKLFIRQILPETKTNIDLSVLYNLNQIIGIPFLVLAFLLLVYWIYKQSNTKHIIVYLVLGILTILGLITGHILFYNYKLLTHTSQINQLFLALCSLWLALVVFLKLRNILVVFKHILSLGLAFLALTNVLNIFFFQDILMLTAALNILYFLILTILPVSFYYGTVQSKSLLISLKELPQLYKKLGVTLREEEVIKEIEKGLTNQQIADKLFITLQTVKDHNSRIYLKLGVKNRTQLIRLLHEQNIQ